MGLENEQPKVTSPKAAGSGATRATTMRENFIARNIQATHHPKKCSNTKGKKPHKKKSPRDKYGKK